MRSGGNARFHAAFLPWDNGANAYDVGAEWQITVQATETGDRLGTTCWMANATAICPGNTTAP